MTLAANLYDRGLIVTREPMKTRSDDDDDDDDDSCDTMSQSSADSASEA